MTHQPAPFPPFWPGPLPRPPQSSAPAPAVSFPAVPPPPVQTVYHQPCAGPSYPSHPTRALCAPAPNALLPYTSYHQAEPPRARPNNAQVREWMRSLGTDMRGLALGRGPDTASPPRDKPLPPLPPMHRPPPYMSGPASGNARVGQSAPPPPWPPHRPVSLPDPSRAAAPPVPAGRPLSSAPLRAPPRPAISPAPPVPLPPVLPPPVPAPPVPAPPAFNTCTPPGPRRFAPSFHPSRPRPSHEALLAPPASPAAPTPSAPPPPARLGQSRSDSALPRPGVPVIDLTAVSDSDASFAPSSPSSSSSASSSPPARAAHVTPRTPLRRRRAASEATPPAALRPTQPAAPPRSTPRRAPRPRAPASPSPPSAAGSPAAGPAAVCAGFTRAGQPCKRRVRALAPGLALAPDSEPRPRYCKDHAGLVCAAAGFYWRTRRGSSGVWVAFDDYVPLDLGQQTQTVLRVTMESALTDNDQPGFLYVYELRDLGDARTSFFKVGRSDNVPRRIGQWTQQCTSHTPTLRDVFPLRPLPGAAGAAAAGGAGGALARKPSAPGSLLPGAVSAGTGARRMAPAVKRWERLVHLELAERARAAAPGAVDALAEKCPDCGRAHREIFPLARQGGYARVVEVVERWERLVWDISRAREG